MRRRQQGFVVGAEMLILATCVICVAVIAWGAASTKVVAEWADFGSAVGSLDQGYKIRGMAVSHPNTVHDANNPISRWAGSGVADTPDFCDTAACDGGIVMCVLAGGELFGDFPPGEDCGGEPCDDQQN